MSEKHFQGATVSSYLEFAANANSFLGIIYRGAQPSVRLNLKESPSLIRNFHMNTHPPSIGTTFQSVLGAVINSLRTNSERNITQTDIAEQLGINVSTWSRIERGESSLSIEQLVLVAAFLNLPLSGLFEFVEERIDELRKQGVKVAVSKEALLESKILQLSTAQLIGISISSPLGSLGMAAAYGLYKTLLKVKKKV